MSKDRELNAESPFATRRAALGMTAAMTAGLLAEKALSPDSAHAEGVSSVNGKTGVVVLTASNVEAVPTSEVGKPKGVAELNSEGKLVEGELPSSVVTGSHHSEDAKGNIAIGSTLPNLTTAEKNTALGLGAGEGLKEGKENVAIGNGTLLAKSGEWVKYNVAIGCGALESFVGENGREGYNTAIGLGAGGALTIGSANTIVGAFSGSRLTTDEENVFIGCGAGQQQNGLNGTVAIGFYALVENKTGEENVAIGRATMEKNKTGELNTVVGNNALREHTNPEECTAVGQDCIVNIKAGAGNTGVGQYVFGTMTEGEGNTAVGVAAGCEITKGEGNVCIGAAAGPTASGELSNKLYINNNQSATPLILGDFSAKELQFNTTKIGFYGVAPVARAAEIKAATTTATKSSPYGYSTEAQAKEIPEKLNAVITALANVGILK